MEDWKWRETIKKEKKKKQTKAVYLILVSSNVLPMPRTGQERNL